MIKSMIHSVTESLQSLEEPLILFMGVKSQQEVSWFGQSKSLASYVLSASLARERLKWDP